MKRRALFFDNSRSNSRNAQRILAVCDFKADVAKTEQEFVDLFQSQNYELLVYPIEMQAFLEKAKINVEGLPTVLLSQTKIQDLKPFFGNHKTSNILAKNSEGMISPRELITTVKKLFDQDIFGVHHYVNSGTKSEVYHIRDSSERAAYIEAVTEFCRQMHVRTSTIQAVELFCEELLMNAIYDAPRDDKGQELYGQLSRKDRVILKPKQAARMEFACDGEKLVISVSDPFGAITWDTVQHYLAKCFSDRPKVTNLDQDGGAGLGLYFCFNAANSFIINVHPSIRSEFIGIFDLDAAPKKRHNRYSSIHFFSTSQTAESKSVNNFMALGQAS